MLYSLAKKQFLCMGLLFMALFSSVEALDWQKTFLHTGFLEWRYYPQSTALTDEKSSLLADVLWQDHWSWAEWERVTWRWTAKVQWQRLASSNKSVVRETALGADMLLKVATGLHLGVGMMWQKDNTWVSDSKEQAVFKTPVLLLRYRW